jgi:hypothetical protein
VSALKSLAMFGLHVVLAAVIILPAAIVLWAILVIVPDLFVYDGATSFVGWALDALFVGGGGLVIGAVTIVIVFLVGLPVRLIRPVRRWWIANGEIAFVGIGLGGILIVLAWALGSLQTGTQDGIEFRQWVPHLWLLLVGWLVFAFSLTHVWWPGRWRPRRRVGAASSELQRS